MRNSHITYVVLTLGVHARGVQQSFCQSVCTCYQASYYIAHLYIKIKVTQDSLRCFLVIFIVCYSLKMLHSKGLASFVINTAFLNSRRVVDKQKTTVAFFFKISV